MARKASHAISYRLTKFETIAGWLYLPFYLLILNLLLQLANVKFSLGMTALTMNLVYFAVNLLAVTVFLAPIIEETLVRGLVFGSIQPTSRVMAYLVSVILFTLMHNWQYFMLYPAGKVLLSCIPYLPASVALAWTYEKAGTIWASISLHAIVNALSFGLLQLNF